jgi:hypothetical protein
MKCLLGQPPKCCRHKSQLHTIPRKCPYIMISDQCHKPLELQDMLLVCVTDILKANVKLHCNMPQLTCLYYQHCTDTLTSIVAQTVRQHRHVSNNYAHSSPVCTCKFHSLDHMLLHSCRCSCKNSWHQTFPLGMTADTVNKSTIKCLYAFSPMQSNCTELEVWLSMIVQWRS